MHEARRGWYDKGAHVLDADGLSIDDLAPSEVKHRIMTYCMVRFQNEDAGQTQLCYEALVDALTGAPEPVHIRLRWDDPMVYIFAHTRRTRFLSPPAPTSVCPRVKF